MKDQYQNQIDALRKEGYKVRRIGKMFTVHRDKYDYGDSYDCGIGITPEAALNDCNGGGLRRVRRYHAEGEEL